MADDGRVYIGSWRMPCIESSLVIGTWLARKPVPDKPSVIDARLSKPDIDVLASLRHQLSDMI